ncbi:MAG: t(6)A37 threonylcarbamoyladenosine biosynthesis protein RimN [Planctomycetota bacterium]|jgi:L-threonylcarbamoyladenylate synthase
MADESSEKSPRRSRTTVGTDVGRAVELLRAGRLVAIPTETVYGLAADALNTTAVAAVFEAKQRPTFDPLIVHVPDRMAAQQLVLSFPPLAERLADAFWPGPLTLVLPRQSRIPDLVTSGLPGVGIRVPAHPLTLRLLRELQRPLAAPSANPFGGISPTTPQHVLDGLGGLVDYVLDGGPCAIGLESTVVSLMQARPLLLRPGGVSLEELESVVGPVERPAPESVSDETAQLAPGMLSRHYAPRTPLRLLEPDAAARPLPGQRSGLLTWGEFPEETGFDRICRLSPSGDLKICAANFFASLRDLDSAGLDVIIARLFPEHGLGRALNDRLRRGAVDVP